MIETKACIRVALAHDEHLIRSALIALLEKEPDLVVVGAVASGNECAGLVDETGPDVFVMKADMPNHHPVKAVRTIRKRRPQTYIVVLSAHSYSKFVVDLLKVGVAGYVLNDDPPETLVRAIRAVTKNLDWISPRVAQQVLESVKNNGKSHKAQLTRREREVLQLMAQGQRNAEIATTLDLAEQTIKNYISRMYSKFGVTTRVEAILFAIEAGLIVLVDDRQ